MCALPRHTPADVRLPMCSPRGRSIETCSADIGYRMARALKSPLVLHGVAQQVYERARARYGDDAPSSMPAKLMEEDTGVQLQAPGFEGFTYQDRTSNWDRKLKGGRWKPRSKL